ncbi:putative succinyldiaminopimelate transaminase DapC [Spongiactinospora gelatinilytica]|uniref:Putative succinyldiaminopimelate transaminase DapC n=1 Tax=Spongiactinospora gelatinilytica TaxID=2666298 RepID=A0A2W2G7A5_9ACTN|nr:pyridoxal phosphate-dependent aminotransferase [Spongiactinospora gelatinilytica]PZG30107.1 putative succinyldiaminopimelate transaminase DapC [Spongiactinospora gelatinilytica]
MDEPLIARMREFGTTVFAEMTALAVRTGAINLGQGFPDTDGPPAMLEAAVRAIHGGLNQYPPGPGVPELRQAVSAHRKEHYGLDYDPDGEVLVTVGATEAVAATVLALCEAGDEVVVFEPYYDSYAAAIALSGAVRRPVTLRPVAGRFAFDPDELRAAVGPRTRAILVNSPHNPTGTVFTRDELAAIAEICLDRDLIAITDEVYEHLTFDGVEHVPLATFPGMRERTVMISSAGKTFSATGWKTGWVCAPGPLTGAVQAVKQFLTFTAGAPWQVAVAHALRHELGWVAALRDDLQTKRDRLMDGLAAAGFKVLRPAGTYFVQTDIRPLGFTDGLALTRELPGLAGVVAIPTQVFYDRPEYGRQFVRFAFCKRDEVIDEAAARLAALAGAAARGSAG